MKLGPRRNYHEGWAANDTMITKPSVPYDFCIGFLNVKAVVAAFNQEKALVGAFSVIVQLRRLIVYSTCLHYYKLNHCWAAERETDSTMATF